MTDRYQAAIDDFVFDVEILEDGFEKAIARYEFPYRDGAATEDMGQKARIIKIRAFWLEDTYKDHIAFLAHLTGRDLFELSHPKYGLINGRIETVSVRHDDRRQTAEADITFVQDIVSQEQPSTYVDVQATTEEHFSDGQQEQIAFFNAAAADRLGAQYDAVLTGSVMSDQSILSQFSSLSGSARSYVKEIDAFLALLSAEAPDVANPSNSLVAVTDYGDTLGGLVVGAVARACERDAVLHESLKTSPANYLETAREAVAGLADSAGDFGALVRIAGAQRLALEAAELYKADEDARQKIVRREDAASFDRLGNSLNPEPLETVMTVNELEQSLALVRTDLQAALDEDRGMESLAAMAGQLLDHISRIKLARDKIVSIVLANPLPLHLVCMVRGLPYAHAERLMAINTISNPNFTSGKVNIYAR